jgi:hypothetical protein
MAGLELPSSLVACSEIRFTVQIATALARLIRSAGDACQNREIATGRRTCNSKSSKTNYLQTLSNPYPHVCPFLEQLMLPEYSVIRVRAPPGCAA